MGYALRSDEVYPEAAGFSDFGDLASDAKYVTADNAGYRLPMPFAADFGIVSSVPTLPKGLRDALVDIKKLYSRKANWNSYGARPLSTKAVRPAVELLITAWRVCKLPAAITLNSHGGIDLVWEIGGREMEIGTYPDGRIEIFRDAFDDHPEIDETVSLVAAQALAQEFLT